ncbi:hypothetical protein BDF14DRAFT_1882114 [Spinellus fusiger]|nr:hypothetical protein BDF14DRAFT_1882114 [Spinellus fusiger]
MAKQWERRSGPFRVIERHRTVYSLCDKDGTPLVKNYHGDRLMPYHWDDDDVTPLQNIPPTPDQDHKEDSAAKEATVRLPKKLESEHLDNLESGEDKKSQENQTEEGQQPNDDNQWEDEDSEDEEEEVKEEEEEHAPRNLPQNITETEETAVIQNEDQYSREETELEEPDERELLQEEEEEPRNDPEVETHPPQDHNLGTSRYGRKRKATLRWKDWREQNDISSEDNDCVVSPNLRPYTRMRLQEEKEYVDDN